MAENLCKNNRRVKVCVFTIMDMYIVFDVKLVAAVLNRCNEGQRGVRHTEPTISTMGVESDSANETSPWG